MHMLNAYNKFITNKFTRQLESSYSNPGSNAIQSLWVRVIWRTCTVHTFWVRLHLDTSSTMSYTHKLHTMHIIQCTIYIGFHMKQYTVCNMYPIRDKYCCSVDFSSDFPVPKSFCPKTTPQN